MHTADTLKGTASESTVSSIKAEAMPVLLTDKEIWAAALKGLSFNLSVTRYRNVTLGELFNFFLYIQMGNFTDCPFVKWVMITEVSTHKSEVRVK